jgi:hypothetical protein
MKRVYYCVGGWYTHNMYYIVHIGFPEYELIV